MFVPKRLRVATEMPGIPPLRAAVPFPRTASSSVLPREAPEAVVPLKVPREAPESGTPGVPPLRATDEVVSEVPEPPKQLERPGFFRPMGEAPYDPGYFVPSSDAPYAAEAVGMMLKNWYRNFSDDNWVHISAMLLDEKYRGLLGELIDLYFSRFRNLPQKCYEMRKLIWQHLGFSIFVQDGWPSSRGRCKVGRHFVYRDALVDCNFCGWAVCPTHRKPVECTDGRLRIMCDTCEQSR